MTYKTEEIEMIKLLSLFSGIGAFEKALDNIGEPYELINYCEIDKYASKAYSLIHNVDESKNLRDVCSIDTNKLPRDIDLITYGFPCQDISLAGMQKGFYDKDGGLTRSGLFFTALHIIEETKPKIAIAENVKALTSKRFTKEFKTVLTSLNQAGYQNYWSVLNSKDYGIPQNRERVFIISIRNDIDQGFSFPQKQELELRLKDLLEQNVDEKYFVSQKTLDYILSTGTKNFYYKPEIDLEIARPLTSTMHKSHRASQDNYVSESFVNYGKKMEIAENKIITIGNYMKSNHNASRSVDPNGLAPTVMENHGTVTAIVENYLPIKEATEKGYKEAYDGDYVNIQFPSSKTRRGRVGEQIANTLICNDGNGVVVYPRIRKLTPKECFRLMGFDDKDCDILVGNKISNTQLYKMAGNSIVVDVLENIFIELLSQYDDIFPNSSRKQKSSEICKWDVRSNWELRQINIFEIIDSIN